MTNQTPHHTLLDLHRLVDPALGPLFEPVGLRVGTREILEVDRADLGDLADAGEAQTAMVTIDGGDSAAHLIAEPALCDELLGRIWQTGRVAGEDLTAVERGILQQLLNDVCGQWRSAWRTAGIEHLPSLAMVATLDMMMDKFADGRWLVVRTVIEQDDEPLGVLLFAYPMQLAPVLGLARDSIRWRRRIERGLTRDERMHFKMRLQELRNVTVPLPVVLTADLPLKAVNALERGDIIALDAAPTTPAAFSILDQRVMGRLAAAGGHLALVIDEGVATPTQGAAATAEPEPGAEFDTDAFDDDDLFADEVGE